MSLESVQMPVYFAVENERLLEVYDDVRRAVNVDTASTATQALFSSASANGYQLVVTGAAPKPIDNFKFINVQVNCRRAAASLFYIEKLLWNAYNKYNLKWYYFFYNQLFLIYYLLV